MEVQFSLPYLIGARQGLWEVKSPPVRRKIRHCVVGHSVGLYRKRPSSGQLEEKARNCAAHALKPVHWPAADEIINLILDIQDMKDSGMPLILAPNGQLI